eukprot:3576933-Prymnesium_polylepis.2
MAVEEKEERALGGQHGRVVQSHQAHLPRARAPSGPKPTLQRAGTRAPENAEGGARAPLAPSAGLGRAGRADVGSTLEGPIEPRAGELAREHVEVARRVVRR